MGYLYALGAALLFGANGSVTKIIVDAGLSPAQITLVRVGGTAIAAAIVLLVANRAAFRITARQFATLSVLGIVGVALLQYTYAVALSVIPVGIALLLEYLAVILVALVAFFFFKERVRARLWIAIGCVILGLAVVAQIWASNLDTFGVVMALAAAVCLASYFLIGERVVGAISPMTVAFWTMLVATAFWLVFSGWWTIDPALILHPVSLGGQMASITVPLVFPLLWNVLLGSFTPFFLSLLALRHLTATAVGVVASAEVIVAFLVAWLWLGQSLNLIQIVGAVIVLAGIVIAQTARADKVVEANLAITADDTDSIIGLDTPMSVATPSVKLSPTESAG